MTIARLVYSLMAYGAVGCFFPCDLLPLVFSVVTKEIKKENKIKIQIKEFSRIFFHPEDRGGRGRKQRKVLCKN